LKIELKYGYISVIVGWGIYLVVIFNSFQNLLPIPEQYDWARQIAALIPVIAGHHVLAWRFHTRGN